MAARDQRPRRPARELAENAAAPPWPAGDPPDRAPPDEPDRAPADDTEREPAGEPERPWPAPPDRTAGAALGRWPRRRPEPAARGWTGAGAAGATAPGAVSTRSPGASSVSSASPGRVFVVVGLTPALRVRSRTSRCWSSVIRVITVPCAPARAVRPDRCR